MVAEVTVFPVPGGPWIRLKGRCNTVFTAYTCATTDNTRVSFKGETGTASRTFTSRFHCRRVGCDERSATPLSSPASG